MRTLEERARLMRWTVEQVLEYDRKIEAEVATWPLLTARQKDRLYFLIHGTPRTQTPATVGTAVRPPRPREIAPAPRPAPVSPKPVPIASVYVLGTGADGRVKIGKSVDVGRRTGDISRMSPVPLELLWSTPGGYELERALHEEFKTRRLHGEWFDFSGLDPVAEISAAAERINAKSAPIDREEGRP